MPGMHIIVYKYSVCGHSIPLSFDVRFTGERLSQFLGDSLPPLPMSVVGLTGVTFASGLEFLGCES
jgi:hypothetical protein